MQIKTIVHFVGCCSAAVLAAPVSISPHAVAVPDATTAKLPTPHGHTNVHSKSTQSVESCNKFDLCLSESRQHSGKDAEAAFQTCIEKFCKDLHGTADPTKVSNRSALCSDKGKEAWFMLSRAAKTKHSTSLVVLRSERPNIYRAAVRIIFSQDATDAYVKQACSSKTSDVPVPAKTSQKLPNPHGHPEADATKTQSSASPQSCQRLDACLAKAGGEDKDSVTDFKACVKSFCDEVYAGVELKKTDSRSSVCDDKGKQAWEILAKANQKAQAQLRANKKGQSFVDLRSYRPEVYSALLQTMFPQDSTSGSVQAGCRLQ